MAVRFVFLSVRLVFYMLTEHYIFLFVFLICRFRCRLLLPISLPLFFYTFSFVTVSNGSEFYSSTICAFSVNLFCYAHEINRFALPFSKKVANAQKHFTSHKSTTSTHKIIHFRKVPNVELGCHLLHHVHVSELSNDVISGRALDEFRRAGNLAPECDDESIEILLVQSRRGSQPDRGHEHRQDCAQLGEMSYGL